MTEKELASFDYKNPPNDGTTGWAFEVNLNYPKNLHDQTAHRTFPLAAETRTLTNKDLSATSQSIFRELKHLQKETPFVYKREKLVSTFYDREKYITSHHNLKFYLENGLTMTGPAIRGITYNERPIFESYINHCSKLRAQATSDFMRRVLKLMSNVRILFTHNTKTNQYLL